MPDDPQLDSLKLPPHSLEAEQSVLGGLLLDNEAVDKVADVLADADFYSEAHRLIYAHILKLAAEAKPADVVTVSESLASVQKLEYVGGLVYLGALVQNVPTAANIRHYAHIVRDRSILRQLAATAGDIADSAYNPLGRSAKEVLDQAEAKVLHIAEQGERGVQQYEEIGKILPAVVERIETLYNRDNPSDVTGVPTGFADLDQKTSGFQPGDLIVIAGRPSMGKTALALNIGEHVALNTKMPVAVFSMEMGASQLAQRMIGSVGRLDQHKLRTGRIASEDWDKLSAALGRLSEAPIMIDETPALNAIEVRSRARRIMRTYGKLGLVIVDYLQLMQATTSGENRATEISEISRAMKSLAKELKVPVVALSQLNRSLEQRPNKRPVMSDLRECVTGDTIVLLSDGRRAPIRDLVGTEPEVWALSDERKIVAARSDRVWSVGVRPIKRVSLASGRSIRVSDRHRLYGATGWVRAEALRPGDRLALARHIPARHNRAMAGPSSGASRSPRRRRQLSRASAAALHDRIGGEQRGRDGGCEAMGSTVSRHAGRGAWHQLVISGNGNRWQPAGVNRWLRELGVFGQRSHEKRLPADVFRLSDVQIALLLRHLWATDGCIATRKVGAKGADAFTSAPAARASHAMSRRCSCAWGSSRGCATLRAAHIGRCSRSMSPGGRHPPLPRRVGAFGPRCEPARRLRASVAGIVANTNVDTLPIDVFERVREAMREQGVTQRAMATLRGTAYGGTAHFCFAPSREVIADYANLLQSAELQCLADADLFWDRVVDVAPMARRRSSTSPCRGPRRGSRTESSATTRARSSRTQT